MSDLTIINKNGQLVTDSREVAEMTGKKHSNLMRDIKGYKEVLDQNSKLNSANFFIDSEYQAITGQKYPCFLLTRKGCDMVANKMTGEKGVLFTAAYVTRFEEMENQIRNNPINTSELSPELQAFNQIFQSLAKNELAQKRLQQEIAITKEETAAVKEEVAEIREVIEINPGAEWRKQTNNLLNKICKKLNDYKIPKEEVYRSLESRGKCKLKIRLDNLKGRALREGMAPSKVNNLNNLDVIANDIRLKEIYIAIVKELSIKYEIA